MDKIAHIGIAVENLDEIVRIFEKLLNRKCDSIEILDKQNLKIAKFELDNVTLEFVTGTKEPNSLSNFLKKRGNAIHHICLEVDDIKGELSRLKKQNFKLIDEKPRIGAGGKLVAFLHPKSTGKILIELTKKQK